MNGETQVMRVPIFQYIKSGKKAAIAREYEGYWVFEFDPDLRKILKIRQPKYVKQDLLFKTSLSAEIAKTPSESTDENGRPLLNFRLIRVLSPEDTDVERWKTTRTLAELPVSPLDPLTLEERIWAGERPGNIGGGVLLSLAVPCLVFFSLANLLHRLDFAVLAPTAVGFALTIIRYKWRPARRPSPDKVAELLAHKKELRESRQAELASMRTEFDRRLKSFGEWENLDPESFEIAIARRLESEGFSARTTRYSGDGGIDIEAVDEDGRPTIVQVKYYSGSVGVAVVREMIGVRETRADDPRVIVYALNGFTRGAVNLARDSSIELRSVRAELVG